GAVPWRVVRTDDGRRVGGHNAVYWRLPAACPQRELGSCFRLRSAPADAARRLLLFPARAKAACPGPETVHGCRGRSVPAARGGVGAAAICSGGEFPRGPQTRGSRRILVPAESVFVSLRLY